MLPGVGKQEIILLCVSGVERWEISLCAPGVGRWEIMLLLDKRKAEAELRDCGLHGPRALGEFHCSAEHRSWNLVSANSLGSV